MGFVIFKVPKKCMCSDWSLIQVLLFTDGFYWSIDIK